MLLTKYYGSPLLRTPGCAFICLLFAAAFSPFSCSSPSGGPDLTDPVRFEPHTVKGAPGYFRVGRSTDGQWWFLTPDNEPFFYKGVCAVNRAGTAGGRRAMDGPYARVVDSVYGYQENPDTFVYAQFDRLRSWGFNALGAWTTEEFFEKGMPYTEILEFFKEGPFLELPGETRPLPDIFDPEWIEHINRKARTLCAPKHKSRDLIGYFTDNEIGFGRSTDVGMDLGFTNTGRFGFSLLRNLLALEEGVAARERAWEFILGRHGDMEGLSEAWDQNIRNAADLRRLNNQRVPITTEAYLSDAGEFTLVFAEHYFRTTYRTIKRYDPNHLVMGCRFGAPPDSLLLERVAPWMDVLSQNNYRPSLYQRIDYLHRQTGLPVLIGEFSWNPDLFKYVPLPGEPEGGYSVKERVFTRGGEVLLRTATHPATVGYTWYRWVHGSSEGERFTFGLVDRDDRVEMHVPAITGVNSKLVPQRLAMHEVPEDYFTGTTGSVSLTLEGFRPGWDHLLNLEVENGRWNPKAFGWQMEADIHDGYLDEERGSAALTVDFKEWYYRGRLASEHHTGQYQVEILRDGQYLSGRYSGTFDGEAVSGRIHGYYLPPLPEID